MKHIAFLGDGEKTFALTTPMILELERKTGHAAFALFTRMRTYQASLTDITETIRCALIGGGTEPREAADLVWTYVENRPLAESLTLAMEALMPRLFGAEDNSQDDLGHAAATGNLAAAMSEADRG